MKNRKFWMIIFSLVLLATLVISTLFYQGKFGSHIRFKKTTFNRLPNWNADDHTQALIAFKNSCTEIVKRNPTKNFGKNLLNGKVQNWQTICTAANQITNPSALAAKQFFETWFEPYHMTNNFNPQTLFTGYYLPLLKGSYQSNPEFNVPVYGVPRDLIEVKLDEFGQSFLGKKPLYGQLKGTKLHPYPNRAAISKGAIAKTADVIVWSNNIVDLFFAQIQGSALVQLPNGEQIIIGYAGSNGRAYTPIGRVLIQKKLLSRENVSMQSIRQWLNEHPDQVRDILNKDASYVFFRSMHQKNPVGSEGVPLTPARTLAVDTRYLPLGAPIWIHTHVITSKAGQTNFSHLLIAQDTGGAIKGMHNDIYWGAGDEAAYTAGHLKNQGQAWLLLPRNNFK